VCQLSKIIPPKIIPWPLWGVCVRVCVCVCVCWSIYIAVGLSQILNVNHGDGIYETIFSASTDITIACNFANDSGIVFEIDPICRAKKGTVIFAHLDFLSEWNEGEFLILPLSQCHISPSDGDADYNMSNLIGDNYCHAVFRGSYPHWTPTTPTRTVLKKVEENNVNF